MDRFNCYVYYSGEVYLSSNRQVRPWCPFLKKEKPL